MNGILQVLEYADDINIIGDNFMAKIRNADASLNVFEDIGLGIMLEKSSVWKQTEIGPWRKMCFLLRRGKADCSFFIEK